MQDIEQIKEDINPVLVQETSITVINVKDYNAAAEFLKEVKSAQKRVTDFFALLKKKTHEAWKAVIASENQVLNPLKAAEISVKEKMLTFQQEQQRKAYEEQAQLQVEADARAERERQRLLKQAEKLKTPELKEQRITEAEEIDAPVVSVHIETPKVAGISTRKVWKAEVTDKLAFIEAAIKDSNLLGFITIDESALNRVAQATKGALEYPGVKFYENEIMAARN